MPHTCIRAITALLAFWIGVCSFIACSQPPEDNRGEVSITVTDGPTLPSETIPETDPLADALEAVRTEVDWGGKSFGMLYVDAYGYGEEFEEVEGGDASIINEAVHNRNTLFEEYGNLELNLIPVSAQNATTSLQAEVQSGSGDFELVTMTTAGTASAATSLLLFNYLALDIDYEHPWWDQGTLDFALNGKVFFMNGPFNIVDDDVTFLMYFNKTLREVYNVPSPYDTVKAGEWTLDYFHSLIAPLGADNGDGTWDENDTYGFASPATLGDTLFYGAGLRYVRNDPSMTMPELALDASQMERALNLLSAARAMVHDGHCAYVVQPGHENLANGIFAEGRSLFFCEVAGYMRSLTSNMKSEFGVVPIPKYNKEQENYHTWSSAIGSTLSIPTSVAKEGADLASFARVLELYTLLSQQYVHVAYYDTMLTTQNVYDSESAEMVDYIFRHRTYDLAICFIDLGFSDLFAKSVAGADTFSSTYKAKATRFSRSISTIMSKLDAAD